jgi:hypothetical protein
MLASAVCATSLIAQAAPDPCSLATDEEFQTAHGVNPQIGIIPDTPIMTETKSGAHCDYQSGSIRLFTNAAPQAALDGLLAAAKADKQRVPVQGLGERAFFTVIYPDDKYRRAGLLAVTVGPRIVTFTMDTDDKPAEETRPKLESLAKLALPRLK